LDLAAAILVRQTGLALPLIGFTALCWLSFFIYPIAHSIIVSHYDRLPRASDTFSREDVQREIRDSAFDSLHYCRVLIVPGLMMLAGGLLLGVTRRDKDST